MYVAIYTLAIFSKLSISKPTVKQIPISKPTVKQMCLVSCS